MLQELEQTQYKDPKTMSFLKKYLFYVPEEEQSSAAMAYLAGLDYIEQSHPSVARAIVQELKDQRSFLKLIASENYSSLAVQLAMGNLLTDKYAEGVVGKRFYAGCQNVDHLEALAVEELKTLFQVDHAYVQPHSGADANLVAYWAILVHKIQNKQLEKMGKKGLEELSREEAEQLRQQIVGQKIMGLSLRSGGHLTHGYMHNLSSKMMESCPYDVDPLTHLLDYTAIREQARAEKPLILVAGYSSYPRKINFAKMREIADEVGAVLLVDMAHFAGLVAGGVFKGEFNPVPYAHVITSTTHKTLRGPRGGIILCTREYQQVIDKGCPLALGGPLPHVIAAKAIAFKEAQSTGFKKYAHKIVENAQMLAEEFMRHGVHVTTRGTDNHLLVIDVYKSFGLTGRQAEQLLREAGITVNRNAVPFDAKGVWHTSGMRIGPAALTTLGMQEEEMKEIVQLILQVLKNGVVTEGGKEAYLDNHIGVKIREKVQELLHKFPLYPEIKI